MRRRAPAESGVERGDEPELRPGAVAAAGHVILDGKRPTTSVKVLDAERDGVHAQFACERDVLMAKDQRRREDRLKLA